MQDSNRHGKGLFAKRLFSGARGDFLELPLVGSFEVHDSEPDSVEATKRDGLPRFLVSSNMGQFLSDGEVARPKAGLYLVPHKASPLFYMNSSSRDADAENFSYNSVLTPSVWKGGDDMDKVACLKNATNCILFNVEDEVQRDTEMLAYYRFED